MRSLINPGFWLVALLLALGLFGAGYTAGSKYESAKCAADQARAQRATQKVTDQENTRREQVAATRETSREQIRIVYRTIREKAHELKTAPHPSPLPTSGERGHPFDCGLDADGLRLWNAANSGTAAPVRGEPDGDLSATAPGALGEVAGSAGQSHRGDGAIQPVPRPDGQTAGMPG